MVTTVAGDGNHCIIACRQNAVAISNGSSSKGKRQEVRAPIIHWNLLLHQRVSSRRQPIGHVSYICAGKHGYRLV